MKLILEKAGIMKVAESVKELAVPEEFVVLRVLYCAVCRTDAKMWQQGHRDLQLPRVLGHEIAGIDDSTGILYTVWPGQVCDVCQYCLDGRENHHRSENQ